MRINCSYRSVSINVIPGEQKVAKAECKLAVRMARCMPDFEFSLSNCNDVPVMDSLFDFDCRHFKVNILSRNFSKGFDSVACFK